MSPYAAPEHLHRLIAEELQNDDQAVRRVEQFIEQVRAEQKARNEWLPDAPQSCDYGRVPHC